jgi:hypothetical protein
LLNMEEIVPTQTLLGYNAAGLPLTCGEHGAGATRAV